MEQTLFQNQVDQIINQIDPLCEQLELLPLVERIEALNRIRAKLHETSPFADEPVDCVQWIKADLIESNDYNPNRVAPPEMRLLRRSIREDGFTQPIVGWQIEDKIEVVDGFHRTRVGREDKKIRKQIHGYLPVSLIKVDRHERKDRIAATIRHNRARGVHGVIPLTDIVAELIRQGWTDDEVAQELGMDADEVLRFKHVSGLPGLFKDHNYSKAWK